MNETEAREVLRQIGTMNVLAISGGRWGIHEGDLILPVSNGYKVRVHLDLASDTYTVTREFVRAGKITVKGVQTNVYCDEVGEVAYRAHAFRSYEFGSVAA